MGNLLRNIGLKHLNTSSAGEYRTEAANFPISISQVGSKHTPTYSASIEGVLQFLSFWIIDNPDPIHTLSFSINDTSKPHTWTNFMVRAYNGNVLALQGNLQEKSANLFDANKHYFIIKELLSKAEYTCFIDSAPYLENHSIQSTLQSKMQSIIDEFEEDICTATTPDEKIYIIAKHVQRIEQLHPFLDGNIRTCYILINPNNEFCWLNAHIFQRNRLFFCRKRSWWTLIYQIFHCKDEMIWICTS